MLVLHHLEVPQCWLIFQHPDRRLWLVHAARGRLQKLISDLCWSLLSHSARRLHSPRVFLYTPSQRITVRPLETCLRATVSAGLLALLPHDHHLFSVPILLAAAPLPVRSALQPCCSAAAALFLHYRAAKRRWQRWGSLLRNKGEGAPCLKHNACLVAREPSY